MIRSFACKQTQAVFHRQPNKMFHGKLLQVAYRKLLMIDAAVDLRDLRVPPGNRLEALHGNREGQYSIRVNDQLRVCFTWQDGGAENVEIVDYH